MKDIFRFFAERQLLATLMTLMILLVGAASALRINRAQFPKVDFGAMVVTTHYPGASPEDVELNVTSRIEDELRSVSGIKLVVSTSFENFSQVQISLDESVSDLQEVKDSVREAVGRISEFPVEVRNAPNVADIKTTIFPVIEIGIAGELPYGQLREIARRFEKKLENLPGVSRLQRHGYRAQEVQIEVSPGKLRAFQLPLREIIEAVRARNIRSSGGTFESYTSEKNVVTLAQFKDPQEVGDVIVRSSFDGPLVRVKDLAVIEAGFEDERVQSRLNGKRAISWEIIKGENADVIRTVAAVRALAAEEQEFLPAGSEFLFINDVSTLVKNRFDIVRSNGLIGLAFVLVILALFLNLRTAFWVALGIPVTLLGVVALLPIFGADLDGIALSAMVLVIGIVVDDAIIIAENINRRRQLGDPPVTAAVEGLREVARPVVTTLVTTFLAFAPMFVMKGVLGKFVFVIPLVVSLALLISMAESFLALPAHLVPSLRKLDPDKRQSFSERWFAPIRSWFELFSRRLLRWRYVSVVVVAALLGGSFLFAATRMDFVLFPSHGADRLFVEIELPPGSSLNATSDKLRKVEAIIAALPEGELDSYGARVGMQLRSGGESENTGLMVIALTPYTERERTAEDVAKSLRESIGVLDGIVDYLVHIDTGGPPVGKPLTLRMVGSDDALRRKLADDVVGFLRVEDGVTDIGRDDKVGKQEIRIKIDHDRMARMGLTVADVARNVRIAYDGEVVTSIRQGEEEIDFRVILEEEARRDTKFLEKLLIPNAQNRLISLKDVASLQTGPGPAVMQHFDGERAVTVEANVDREKASPSEITDKVLAKFDVNKDYPGIRFVVGGEVQEQEESMINLALTFGLAMLSIYFLLVLLFNSFTQPLMVVAAVPLGMIGVIIAFAAHGQPLGFFSILGGIGLIGVVVNDSLVLVNHLNDLRREQPEAALRELVATGAANRLRAISLTTVTTVMGLLPLVYGLGGSDLYVAPMAMALGYGLLFATPLSLVVVPALYVIGHDIRGLFGHAQ